MREPYDAVLLVSFGGPEKPDDVIPFLENVLRGTNVPRERIGQVVKRYELFGGQSPANAEIRALLAALVTELNAHGPQLPVYWGNRHWHPLLADAIEQMAEDGVRRALALVTSAFGSYYGCRQYLEDIERARKAAGPEAPQVDKLRLFYNHPGFIEAMSDQVAAALSEVPAGARDDVPIVYTAHSIPVAMAAKCAYVEQLREACRLVSERLERSAWALVYQSRSGPPREPWLGPDVGDYLRGLADQGGTSHVVVAPIGFVFENMETVYDLDVEAARLCQELGLNMVRCPVVAGHPLFARMIRQLVAERIGERPARPALGSHGASHDVCAPDCCPRS